MPYILLQHFAALYKMNVVHYITQKALSQSLPSSTLLSVISFHLTVSPNKSDLPKITLQMTTLIVTLQILTVLVFTNDRND
jgi:hypothetical protein